MFYFSDLCAICPVDKSECLGNDFCFLNSIKDNLIERYNLNSILSYLPPDVEKIQKALEPIIKYWKEEGSQ